MCSAVASKPPDSFELLSLPLYLIGEIRRLLNFEVLSPTTEKIDLREKFVNYRRLSSLREFISVHQDCRRVVCYSDTFGWNAKYLVEKDDVLHLPSFDLSIPLSDICRKVELPEEK